MAIALLKGLTEIGMRLGGFIEGFILEGFSRRKSLFSFRAAVKEPIIASDFNKNFDLINNALTVWDRMKFVTKAKVIRRGYLDTTAILKQKYLTTIETTFKDRETGVVFNEYFSVGHSLQRKRGLLEGEAGRTLIEKYVFNADIIGQRPVEGLIRL